jgi:hypothetical protein
MPPFYQSSTIEIALTSLQNSSRFLLGFLLKLSHAPLQVSCPQNHKIAAFIKSVLSAGLIF